jgi:hypothetical protein
MSEQDRVDPPTLAPNAGTSRGNVSLHIERLVLDGFALTAGQMAQVQAAVQHELKTMFERDGAGALPGTAVSRVAAPAIRISHPLRAADLGRQIARSVNEALKRSL